MPPQNQQENVSVDAEHCVPAGTGMSTCILDQSLFWSFMSLCTVITLHYGSIELHDAAGVVQHKIQSHEWKPIITSGAESAQKATSNDGFPRVTLYLCYTTSLRCCVVVFPYSRLNQNSRKTIFTEYMIFRQIATSWSYIHLLCQKRWHKSFFWAKCLTTQSTVGTRILPMGQRYQRASFLEVIRESCLSSDLIGSPDTNLHTAAP